MENECRLCQMNGPLMQSHIIPKFIYKELKKNGGGYLRDSTQPNKRIQDGHKTFMLCQTCESKLSRYENYFKGSIFEKIYARSSEPIRLSYDTSLLKFCVSISWRILQDLQMEKNLSASFSEFEQNISAALSTWREFMLGDREDPGEFKQYMMVLGHVKEASRTLPMGINAHISQSIDCGLVRYKNNAAIYAKMMKILLLSPIKKSNNPFGITNIRKNGYIITGNQKINLPPGVCQYVFVDRHNEWQKSMNDISEEQTKKIRNNILSNAASYQASDAYQAHLADIALRNKPLLSK